MIENTYPKVLERAKAMTIDGIVMLVFIFLISILFSMFKEVSDTARIAAFVFVFLLYDPIFTSVFGGTIGHMMMGIRVKKLTNENQNIMFPLAIIRYMVKAFLGWFSLLTISSNEKRQAIHDTIVCSVVIYSKSNVQV